MKKISTFLICLMLSASFIFSSPLSVVAEAKEQKEDSNKIIENFCDSLDGNLIFTPHEDGVLEVEMKPLSAYKEISDSSPSFDLDAVTEEASVYDSGRYPDYTYTYGQTHIPVSDTSRFLYSCLTSTGKDWYKKIDTAIKNFDEEVMLSPAINEGDNYKILFIYLADHPELFYVCNRLVRYSDGRLGLYYSVGNGSGESSGYQIGELSQQLKSKILAKKAVFDNAVNSFVSSIPYSAPDIVKEALIYNKILINSYYNMDAINNDLWDGLANDNWTSYGILCNGYGVCESYSEVFQTLCIAVGINCTPVVGDVGGGHKWNAVKIGGNWYQCDVTFDDPIGGDPNNPYFDYFNITDSQMQSDGHTWDDGDYPTPVCTATMYSKDYLKSYHNLVTNNVVHCFENACDSSCDNCSYRRSVEGHRYVNGVCTRCGDGGSTPPDTPIFPDIPDPVYKNGWILENGNWYYYENGVTLKNQWIADGNGVVYLGSDGAMLTNSFIYDSFGNETHYVGPNGYVLKNTWLSKDGYWYYLTSQSRPVKNDWLFWQNSWYHFDLYGHMETNAWISDGSDTKRVDENGCLVSSAWVHDGNGWRYLDANGNLLKNAWQNDSKGWCYVGSDGYMYANRWHFDSVGLCFIGPEGYCLTNSWKQHAKGWVYFNANGSQTKNAWVMRGSDWIYLDSDGFPMKSQWMLDSKGWCYLDEDGVMATEAWVPDSVGLVYVGADGYMVRNRWVMRGSDWCYVGADGYPLKNQWMNDSRGWCYLDSDGIMVTNAWVRDSVGWCYLNHEGYWDYIYHSSPAA